MWVCFSRKDCFPMVPEFYRAAKKAWFRTIQEVYCWRENPSLALQTEALQSWTSRKPAQPPVCSFSMACRIMKPDRVRGGADTRADQEKPQYLSITDFLSQDFFLNVGFSIVSHLGWNKRTACHVHQSEFMITESLRSLKNSPSAFINEHNHKVSRHTLHYTEVCAAVGW